MSDRDTTSDLHERLRKLETNLTYAHQGKSPPKRVDLLSWRADTSFLNRQGRSVVRDLRENWHGLSEAIRTWTIRFDARFGR